MRIIYNLDGEPLTKVQDVAHPRDSFTDVVLERADFSGKHLVDAYFHGVNLTGASFAKANLSGASFAKANLTGVDFTDAILLHVNFYGANLYRASLGHTMLGSENLHEASGIYSFGPIVVGDYSFGPINPNLSIGYAVLHESTVFFKLSSWWADYESTLAEVEKKYGVDSSYAQQITTARNILEEQRGAARTKAEKLITEHKTRSLQE